MDPSPPALGAQSSALDRQARPEPEFLTSARPGGQSVQSGGRAPGWRGARLTRGPARPQVPLQALRDADGPAVAAQRRVCPAAAAALHGHGGAPERRALLGEPQRGVGAAGPPCLGTAEELGAGGSRLRWNRSFSSQQEASGRALLWGSPPGGRADLLIDAPAWAQDAVISLVTWGLAQSSSKAGTFSPRKGLLQTLRAQTPAVLGRQPLILLERLFLASNRPHLRKADTCP